MRKPRDFDAELKALDEKAKALKDRKTKQLGELVIATGADALSVEELAGTLLLAIEGKGPAKEECKTRGERFFCRPGRGAATRAGRGPASDTQNEGQAQSAAGQTSAS